MAKILICTTGQTGILNASLEVGRRLKYSGHQLLFAAPRAKGKPYWREGYSFRELPEILMEPAGIGKLSRSPLKFIRQNLSRLMNRRKNQQLALENTRPTAFVELCEEFRPELILIDIELHEYILAAHGTGQNYVLISQWYSLWKRKGLPYLLTDTIPGKGETGSEQWIEYDWGRISKERNAMFSRLALHTLGSDRRSTLLRLARDYSFPLSVLYENYWPGAFTYDRLPVIALAPLEMEFPHDVRPNLHYAGPMVYGERKEEPAISHRAENVETILNAAQEAGRKIILVTVSTLSRGDVDFLRRVVKAVGDEEEWTVLMSLGGKLSVEYVLGVNVDAKDRIKGQSGEDEPSWVGTAAQRIVNSGDTAADLPANVHAFAYIPQLRVLRAADLSINHGGIHTIHECLHFGVPMLVYHGKKSDQPGCAARVQYHGVGVMADKDVDVPSVIREKINMVLSWDTNNHVTEMRRLIEHYREDRVLENLVARFVEFPHTKADYKK